MKAAGFVPFRYHVVFCIKRVLSHLGSTVFVQNVNKHSGQWPFQATTPKEATNQQLSKDTRGQKRSKSNSN